MAVNCGGGKGLFADIIAINEARMAATRNLEEKDVEERMFLWEIVLTLMCIRCVPGCSEHSNLSLSWSCGSRLGIC